jgi:hypothetical protein
MFVRATVTISGIMANLARGFLPHSSAADTPFKCEIGAINAATDVQEVDSAYRDTSGAEELIPLPPEAHGERCSHPR